MPDHSMEPNQNFLFGATRYIKAKENAHAKDIRTAASYAQIGDAKAILCEALSWLYINQI